MTTITVPLNDKLARRLRGLAAAQQRSVAEVVRDAVYAYVETARPYPRVAAQSP